MARGNIVGTAPTQGITEDFGGIVQQGMNQLIAGDERRRQREKERQEQLAEMEEKYGLPEDMLYLDTTEFRSVNDASTEAMSQYRDRYYEVYKMLQNDPSNLMLKKRLQSIKGGVMQLKSVHEKMKAMGEKYLEAVANDQVSEVHAEQWREALEAYDEGRIRVHLNDKDIVQVATYDKEGNITGVKDFRELINDDLIARNDIPKELDAMVKRIGTKQEEVPVMIDGKRYLRKQNVFGAEQRLSASREIDAYLQNDEVVADLYQQLVDKSSRKTSGFTEQERLEVKAELMGMLEGRYQQETSLSADPYGVQEQRARDARALKAMGDDEKKPNIKPAVGDNSQPATDGQGNFIFSLTEPTMIDPTKTQTRISSIKATADGQITLVGQEQVKQKGDPLKSEVEAGLVTDANGRQMSWEDILLNEEKNTSVTYYKKQPFTLSPSDPDYSQKLNSFAAMSGYEDVDQLRDAIYRSFVERFGKEAADKYFNEEAKQEARANRASAPENQPSTDQTPTDQTAPAKTNTGKPYMG